MENLIIEILKEIVTPSSIAALALLLVIFWMFKFTNKLIKADKRKTETLAELTVLLQLLVNRRRSIDAEKN